MHHLQHIAELGPLLESAGVRHAILAPGSRNAPLTQLFTSGGAFSCYSVVDERSAGYMALGMARQLEEPVAVVTTSGTAVLNLGPAAAEAFHQNLPLILLTADRPLETLRQFDNQVIDQQALFYNHTRGFYAFDPEPRSEPELQQAMEAAGALILEALLPPGGPVHLNFPLVEPLYVKLPEPLLSLRISGLSGNSEARSPEGWVPSAGDLTGRKVLLLAGMGNHGNGIRDNLMELSALLRMTVVAENISNLASDRFVTHPELLLAGATGPERKALVPDLVITFGGQVVSKRLKHFIGSLAHVEIREIDGDPLTWLRICSSALAGSGRTIHNDYLASWKRIEAREQQRFAAYLEGAGYSNLTAVRTILSSVPRGSVVHLGNSATIRYSQLMEPVKDLTFYSNRGTSGIDGCVSSAVGAALVSDRLHVLVLGDLSFVYDSNALWNQHFPRNLKIIVLNDGGGGIFRLLEGPDRMDFFEKYSVTHHPVSIELLAQSFGRVVQRASGGSELRQGLETLFNPGSTCSILEVDTTACENSRIFKHFFTDKR